MMNITTFKSLEARQGIRSYSPTFSIDWSVAQILDEVTQRGIRVDVAGLTSWVKRSEARLFADRAELAVAVGIENFNPNSPAQVTQYLASRSLPGKVHKRELTWLASKLAADDPVQAILRYRSEVRELSYAKSLLASVGSDGRIHSEYDLFNCATGRIYCEPSVQVQPWAVRDFLLPEEGHDVVVFDFRQQELRIQMIESGEDELLAMLDRDDFWQAMASKILVKALLDVTDADKATVKAVVYGQNYGQTEVGLSQFLGVTVDAASELIKWYRGSRGSLDKWERQQYDKWIPLGYVQTRDGRRRKLPPRSIVGREKLQRYVINTIMQGGAAAVLREAVSKMPKLCAAQPELQSVKLMTIVHDSLVTSFPRGVSPDGLQQQLEQTFYGHLPMSIKRAPTWGGCK